MAGLGNATERLVLDFLFGGADATRPAATGAARYVSLHSSDPGDTGANEISDTGYARKAATFIAATGDAPAYTENEGAIVWTNSTTYNWATVGYFGLWDAETTGNYLGGGQFTGGATKLITPNDTATFADGALDITLD